MKYLVSLFILVLSFNAALADYDGFRCTAESRLTQSGQLDDWHTAANCHHKGMTSCQLKVYQKGDPNVVEEDIPVAEVQATITTYSKTWSPTTVEKTGVRQYEGIDINRADSSFVLTITRDSQKQGTDWISEYRGHCVRMIIHQGL
jgi:hypothetical protein